MIDWFYEYKKRAAKIKELGYSSYNEYLCSEHWKQLRRRRLACSEKVCNRCGRSKDELYLYEKEKGSFHVHHIDYENLGREKLEELLLLCSTCHAYEHKRRQVGRRNYDAYTQNLPMPNFLGKEPIRLGECLAIEPKLSRTLDRKENENGRTGKNRDI